MAEWVVWQKPDIDIEWKELAAILPADPQNGLGKVIGPETEEIDFPGKLLRLNDCTGKFHHGSEGEVARESNLPSYFLHVGGAGDSDELQFTGSAMNGTMILGVAAMPSSSSSCLAALRIASTCISYISGM